MRLGRQPHRHHPRGDVRREAFAAGALNQDQAKVIVRAGEDLPAAVTGEQRVAAEAGQLVEDDTLPTDGHGPVGATLLVNIELQHLRNGLASAKLDTGARISAGEAQRRALALRHDTCATEGCERPFAWPEIHHPHPWSHGGETTLTNALPLCWFHHRKAHDNTATIRRLPTGEVKFRRRT